MTRGRDVASAAAFGRVRGVAHESVHLSRESRRAWRSVGERLLLLARGVREAPSAADSTANLTEGANAFAARTPTTSRNHAPTTPPSKGSSRARERAPVDAAAVQERAAARSCAPAPPSIPRRPGAATPRPTRQRRTPTSPSATNPRGYARRRSRRRRRRARSSGFCASGVRIDAPPRRRLFRRTSSRRRRLRLRVAASAAPRRRRARRVSALAVLFEVARATGGHLDDGGRP